MLVFTAYSLVGHTLHVCSMVTFVIGDEDVVLPNFESESYRFTEQALIILKAVGNVIANFKDKGKLSIALKDLQAVHYPIPLHDKELTAQHFRVFHVSLWRIMKKIQITKPSPNFKFAFRALVLDMELLDSSLEEISLVEWTDMKSCIPASEKEYSPEEVAAAIKIQAMWRGTYVRLLMKARIPDTKENISVADILQRVWAILELNMEQYALSLLRLMFKSKCKSIESYPCYQDEDTKIYFADYTVTYQDQPPNSWFIVFRYSVKVTVAHLITVHVRTSKPDAFIKLQILENEESIVSTTGKGQAIIPAFYFSGSEKALSSQSSKQVLSTHTVPKKEQEVYAKKKTNQGSQKPYKNRPGSAVTDTGLPLLEEEIVNMPTIDENSNTTQQGNKYIIQCLVLYNSWPLTESQLTFVQALKELEKNDNKAHVEKHEELITLGSPDSHTISEGQKSSGTSKTTRKGKEKSSEKEKTAKEKQVPRFEPQASQARLHYLGQFIKKMPEAESTSATESQAKPAEEGARSRSPTLLELSPRLIRKELEIVDLNQYIRKTNNEPQLQTDELNQQQAMQKAEEIHQFREYRTRILSIRDIDQEERCKLRDEVLDMYGEMRDSLDEARQKILSSREEYRNKLLEAERLRLEELAAKEAAMRAETEKKAQATDAQKKKKGKKK
ncbi:Calpain-7-like protein [Tupaia chinensis]|uniref:Calpain-7-like protein n=1 Tax=Tupaia chinensis TaxID=246437 RepID=L9LCV8_TUPCH|nr:Calpain-7-like protein [Tupaia chinensis]